MALDAIGDSDLVYQVLEVTLEDAKAVDLTTTRYDQKLMIPEKPE